jgi:hypothetical protein
MSLNGLEESAFYDDEFCALATATTVGVMRKIETMTAEFVKSLAEMSRVECIKFARRDAANVITRRSQLFLGTKSTMRSFEFSPSSYSNSLSPSPFSFVID